MHHITDQERRRRIATRHCLHPAGRADTPEGATEAMTVLHATEPATVYLSLAARSTSRGDGSGRVDVDRALYRERTLVKQLAMRRTLFVFPRDLLPAAWGSASARVAETERKRLIKDVEQHGIAPDGTAWLDRAAAAVLTRLGDVEGFSAARLREELPDLEGRIEGAPGTAYAGSVPVAPRVLTVLAAQGAIVRGDNRSHWRVSRPAWTSMESWLGEQPTALEPAEGYVELVRRWLRTFGPGTETDEQVSAVQHRVLEGEAEALTHWLAGERVGTVYPSPAMKSANI